MLDFEDSHKKSHRLGRVECILLQHLMAVGAPVSLSEIKNTIPVSKSRITHLTDTLVAKGCITRANNSADRRMYFIQITETGLHYAQQFEKKQIKIYDEIISELSEEQQKEMFENLEIWRLFLKEMKTSYKSKMSRKKQI
jgi:DNA-binding MarR family transcriptional regulator